METPKINRRRLRKLANHLINGTLGHKKFNFRYWNVDTRKMIVPYKCGYQGCAIGECPIIFKDWVFDEHGNPKYKDCVGAGESGRKFFGLTSEQFLHLFTSYSVYYVGMVNETGITLAGLPGRSTAKRVGENILRFLDVMKGRKQ